MSIEAERGLLGCLLLEPRNIPAVDFVLHEHFKDDSCRELIGLLRLMYDERAGIDLLTIRQRLKDSNRLDAIGGIEFLMDLQEATPSPLNVMTYAEIVAEVQG